MEEPRICSRCGVALPAGKAVCSACEPRALSSLFEHENLVLAILAVTALVLFAVTSFVSRQFHSRQEQLGNEWHARAEADLAAGRPEQAIEAFRNALVYSRDNPGYQLRLAQAHLAAGQPGEARTYLLNLREREPGNGVINLELARLAARQGNVAEAQRYFHSAAYGVWETNAEQNRLQVRLELSEFLVTRGEKAEAQSALIMLAENLPTDAALHTRVGHLFLKTGENGRALEQFREALRLDSSSVEALVGAGRAAFEMRSYAGAQRYLERAVRQAPEEGAAASLLETVRHLLAIDPFQRRLGSRERSRRAIRAFQTALARLLECAAQSPQPPAGTPPPDLHALSLRAHSIEPQVKESRMRSDPDLLENTMDLVFEIERRAAAHCGAPTGADLALLKLADQRENPEP